jgi:hypothetical protein
MINKCHEAGRKVAIEIANRRKRDAFERTIEVPMLKPMRIAGDNRGFIAMYVIRVIAVTLRMVIFVLAFVVVMVRFDGVIVTMDMWIVSSTVTMMDYAHDIDRVRSNRKWSRHGLNENHLSADRSMRRPDWSRQKGDRTVNRPNRNRTVTRMG